MPSKKDDSADWSESDECKFIVDEFSKGIKKELYIGQLSITKGNQVVELRDIVTDPDNPEDLDALLALIQPGEQVVFKKTAQPSQPEPVPTPTAQPQPVQPQPAQPPAETEQKISDFIAPFLGDKKTANRSNRYADALKDAVENFIEFTGDIDPKLLQKDHARRFAKALENWPSNRRKKAAPRHLVWI